jgi:hypothetical protein
MRERLEEILDIYDLLFLDLGKFLEDIDQLALTVGAFYVSQEALVALSISIGHALMLYPYTSSTWVGLITGFFGNWILLHIFPKIASPMLSQKFTNTGIRVEEKKLREFIMISQILFVLFPVTSLILTSLGIHGILVSYFVFLLNVLLYISFLAYGVSIFYRTELQKVYSKVLKTTGLVLLFPILFYIYLSLQIVQFLG